MVKNKTNKQTWLNEKKPIQLNIARGSRVPALSNSVITGGKSICNYCDSHHKTWYHICEIVSVSFIFQLNARTLMGENILVSHKHTALTMYIQCRRSLLVVVISSLGERLHYFIFSKIFKSINL